MPRGFLLLCLFWLSMPELLAAGKFPLPLSYAKPVGQEFVFVQLGDPAAEAKVATPGQLEQFQQLRATYPQPGLYRVADRSLVWPAMPTLYTPYDYAMLTDDGRYLVRVEGEFWRTESFPGGQRPSAEKQQQQLDSVALSFWEQGELRKSYQLKELVQQVEVLKHSPEHLIWFASGTLISASGKVLIHTQEARRFTFQVQDGTLLEVRDVGLGNPRLTMFLWIAGAMSLVIFTGWLIFAIRNWIPIYDQNRPVTNP
jgi:hypothetical protein